jgi:hypothetical protein
LHCLSPSLEDVHYKEGASEGEGCKMERDSLRAGTPEVMLVTLPARAPKNEKWVLSVHNFGSELSGTSSIAQSRAVVRVYTGAGLVVEFDARAAAAAPGPSPTAPMAGATGGSMEGEGGSSGVVAGAEAVEQLGYRTRFPWWHVAAVHLNDSGVPMVTPIMELCHHAPL